MLKLLISTLQSIYEKIVYQRKFSEPHVSTFYYSNDDPWIDPTHVPNSTLYHFHGRNKESIFNHLHHDQRISLTLLYRRVLSQIILRFVFLAPVTVDSCFIFVLYLLLLLYYFNCATPKHRALHKYTYTLTIVPKMNAAKQNLQSINDPLKSYQYQSKYCIWYN